MVTDQAPVIQRLDIALLWINHCPLDINVPPKPVALFSKIVIYVMDIAKPIL